VSRPRRPPIRDVLNLLGIDALRKGLRWWAACPGSRRLVDGKPAHADGVDRHPSWMIWDDDRGTRAGLHYCYACGFSGSVVDLVVQVRGCSPTDAKKLLKDAAAGIKQDPVASVRVQLVSSSRRLVLPDSICFDPLEKWVTPARRYVLGRGIEPWQVDRWRLGYALEGRLAFRVVFVTRDAHGRPLNYTARTFINDPSEKRYLNGQDDEGIDHGAIFGEEHWPDLESRGDIVVTEGAINGLAAEVAHPMAIGALSGSNLHPAHVSKLSTFRRALVMTDPDRAGDKAARAIEGALGRWFDVVRVRPPEGFDLAGMPIDERRAMIVEACATRRAS